MDTERRRKTVNVKLNLLQKWSMYSLQQVGYSVGFVRDTLNGALVFAFCDGNFVTIDIEGCIDQKPTEALRPI